jgi:hypothetical protein
MLLDVAYARPEPGLRTDLFVGFSRDLDDPARDRGRTQMASEVVFAALSRTPRFPIAVPHPRFADYHAGTGAGTLITDRITFVDNQVEPQYDTLRCGLMDWGCVSRMNVVMALWGALCAAETTMLDTTSTS